MPVKNKKFAQRIGKGVLVIIFLINMFFATLLLLSMSAWVVSPEKSEILAYLGLGFPLLLIINIIPLIFWILLFKWKFALVNVIVLLCSWGAISTYYPLHGRTSKVPNDCIKILSYNVQGFKWKKGAEARKNPIFDYILDTDADIVCLQEYIAHYKKDKPNDGIITEKEVNQILNKYPYHSIKRFGENATPYTFGVACYSKYPIEKITHIPTYSTFNGSVMYEIEVNGKRITLINNHLESNKLTTNDKQLYKDFVESRDTKMLNEVTANISERLGTAYKLRAVQADTIASVIKRQEGRTDAIIVCGDFNDTPISYAYHKIKGDLIDSFAETGKGQGITYNENKFWFRIDYIMHSKNVKSYNCTVDKVKLSDHYPIWTYLQLN